MRGTGRRMAFSGMVLVVGLSLLAAGQSPLGLSPAPIEEPLAVQLWVGRASYMEGDSTTVQFTVNRSAYIYLFEIRPDGTVRMLFPNGYSTQNFVSAGSYTLPEGLYQFPIEGPAGMEHIQIVASLAPLAFPNPSQANPYPLVGTNATEAVALIQAQIDVLPRSDACGPQWVTAWCSFTVIAEPQPVASGCLPPQTCPTYCCPAPAPTPPLSCPPTYSYYCPPVSPTPPLPQPPVYNPCPPVYNPCPPVCNPCWPVFRFFFGFQIHIGTGTP